MVGVPGRIVRARSAENEELEHGKLPDPEGQALEDMQKRIEQLEQQFKELTEEKLSSRQGS